MADKSFKNKIKKRKKITLDSVKKVISGIFSSKKEYTEAIGRRKTSVARVRLFESKKNEVIAKEIKDKTDEIYATMPMKEMDDFNEETKKFTQENPVDAVTDAFAQLTGNSIGYLAIAGTYLTMPGFSPIFKRAGEPNMACGHRARSVCRS